MTTAVRPIPAVSPSVCPLPDGGWLLKLPLRVTFGPKGNRTTPAVPSKNVARRRENDHIYAGRRSALTDMFATLLAASGAERRFPRLRAVRVGKVTTHVEERCVFDRTDLTLTLYHRTRAILLSDYHNWISGAAACFDALEVSQWIVNDRGLHVAEPVLCVDRMRPRVELALRPHVSPTVETGEVTAWRTQPTDCALTPTPSSR